MIRRVHVLVLACMIAIAGCAEGDNLFGDASNAGSGAYARSLATQQQQLDAERSRAAALGARSSELKQRGAALDAAIGQERHKLAVLRARVERLDRDIRSRQAATDEAKVKRADLERQVALVNGQIEAMERQLAGTGSEAE